MAVTTPTGPEAVGVPLQAGWTITWGQQTGVVESRAVAFSGHWTGTGVDSGGGDGETLTLAHLQAMTSDIIWTGLQKVELLQNHYGVGDTVLLEWRTGASLAAVAAAGWTTYSAPFNSSGFVQARVTSTL
jgi:hypothetical protein